MQASTSEMISSMCTALPWADPRVSLKEVQRRLGSVSVLEGACVCRAWELYAQLERTLPRGWPTNMAPGQCYLVVGYKTLGSATSARAVGAAVMRYEGVVPHPNAEIRMRHRAFLLEEYKHQAEHRPPSFDDDDEDDDEDDWFLMNQYYIQRRMWRAACFLLRFRELDSGRLHELDVFGPGIGNGDASCKTMLDVMPLASQSWKLSGNRSSIAGYPTDLNAGTRTMDKLRWAQARLALQGAAALRIQRRWRQVLADPAHPVCRRRLQAEFQQMAQEGGKGRKRKQPGEEGPSS